MVTEDDEDKQPYSILDLAALHNLSRAKVTQLYEDEPDVLVLQVKDSKKRRYRTIRVPPHVYRRVRHRMANK